MQDLDTHAGTVLNGTVAGMIPMAIFTPVYAIWPVFAWPVVGAICFTLATAFSIYLLITGIRTLRFSRRLLQGRDAQDARIAKVMPIISNIMGFGILVAIILLPIFDMPEWILPTVATLVALHFFPMSRLFDRTIDYCLGTMMPLAAAAGFTLGALDFNWQVVWAAIGIIGALVTSTYGLNALLARRRVLLTV